MLNENEVIENLKLSFPDYIGDDAAVIPQQGEMNYVISKDVLTEDIHFRPSYVDPASLAQKALHVNLSDIAAMGAKPQFVLLGISIPNLHEKYASDFLSHFSKACLDASVVLIGGDTTKSPDKFFMSVTAIGTVKKKYIKYRSTAKPGDLICTIGNLGDAHLGLLAFEKSLSNFEKYKNSYLRPSAKINEGQWLGEQSAITSMMDISDGLYIDLKRLCLASTVQSNIVLENLTPTEEFKAACGSIGVDFREVMLTGGEDYGLLFTVKPESYAMLADKFNQKFGYEIRQVGKLLNGTGISFTEKGNEINLKLKAFSHFGEL